MIARWREWFHFISFGAADGDVSLHFVFNIFKDYGTKGRVTLIVNRESDSLHFTPVNNDSSHRL